MSERNSYNTKQRGDIADYLRSLGGKHVTAAEVCEHFKKIGKPIGTATVYRRLERMVEEGVVGKHIVDSNSPACFEYIGEGAHAGEEGECFHCKCESCGKLIHLHCGELSDISRHLMAHHDFAVDPMRTVFYGVCDDCKSAGEGARKG